MQKAPVKASFEGRGRINTISDLYSTNNKIIHKDGGPDATKVDASLTKDKTPLSLGIGAGGSKDIDEPALNMLEARSKYSPGNRYGFQDAALGGGSRFAKGYKDSKTYTSTMGSPRSY